MKMPKKLHEENIQHKNFRTTNVIGTLFFLTWSYTLSFEYKIVDRTWSEGLNRAFCERVGLDLRS